jgi:F0F1-type ATP synthase assembly protein I
VPDEPGQALDWPALVGMGAVIAAVLVVGLGLGWLVDSLAGTKPIFLLIGLLLGIAGAISYTVVEFRKYLKS